MSLDLHTAFAIFLYSFQLETASLTKYVPTDAADAERSVTSAVHNCYVKFRVLRSCTEHLAVH